MCVSNLAENYIYCVNSEKCLLTYIILLSFKSQNLFFFLQNSSSVALLHKHLQLLLPHATDIFSRSATLIKESSWNGNIQEKLQGEDE